uniref:MFS domain-containing protein n=1 Tax=Globodera pallida TaxID=36090 RepID=A0A183C800_GLOPA
MMMFLWTPEEVVFYESIAHSLRGIIALLVYIAYIAFDLGKRVNDRLCCLCSLGALLLFHLVTFSWPFLPENVHKFDGSVTTNSSMPSNGTFSLGCDASRMNWCDGTTRVNVWVYYVAIISCIGLAFSNINVTMNTLFSHIIGPRMQSKQQGMLEMYGGVGRMLGPLLIGFLYIRYGPRAIWLLEIGEIVLMIALWLGFYSRLVPLKMADGWTDRESSDRNRQIAKQSFTGSIT